MANKPSQITIPPENEVKNPNENKSKSCWHLLINTITNITVEPAIFLHFAGFLMAYVMVQSLIIRKVCLHRMNLTDEQCRIIINNKTMEEEAQGYATNFMMYKTVLDTLPSVFWGLFIGSWSDKFGRKYLLIVPNVGSCVSMLLLALVAYKTEWNENYILLSSAIFVLTGGMLVMDTGVMSYIADITTPEKRTLRYGLVSAAILCGAPVGLTIGGQIFKHFNYTYEPVFVISAAVFGLNVLYVAFFIRESVKVDIKKSRNMCLEFLNVENVKQTWVTFIKKRENNGRKQLFLLLLAVSVIFMPLYAKGSLTLTYTRLKFEWDEETFGHYQTADFVFNFLGLMLLLPLMSKLFKWQDITIGIISSFGKILSEILIGISVKGWMLFAAAPIFMLAALTSVIVKTMISRRVSASEQGKIISVISIAEGIVPIIGSAILTPVYNATKATNVKGAVYFVIAGLAVFPILVLIYISQQRKKIANPQTTSTLDLIPIDPVEVFSVDKY
uniref:Major facilitator superfamily (MFS) profile domain-containing protein n=1 Tax=Strigamia maritima TaxID=126957 RepID=T1J6Y8_STRMM